MSRDTKVWVMGAAAVMAFASGPFFGCRAPDIATPEGDRVRPVTEAIVDMGRPGDPTFVEVSQFSVTPGVSGGGLFRWTDPDTGAICYATAEGGVHCHLLSTLECR